MQRPHSGESGPRCHASGPWYPRHQPIWQPGIRHSTAITDDMDESGLGEGGSNETRTGPAGEMLDEDVAMLGCHPGLKELRAVDPEPGRAVLCAKVAERYGYQWCDLPVKDVPGFSGRDPKPAQLEQLPAIMKGRISDRAARTADGVCCSTTLEVEQRSLSSSWRQTRPHDDG